MALSDTGAREIAKVLRKHVAPKTLEVIAAELVEIRGEGIPRHNRRHHAGVADDFWR